MTGYVLRDASRNEAKPLIGFYAESDGGKTYNALLLARAFVGPTGTIGMIETEGGRGEAYADPTEYPEFAGKDEKGNTRPSNYKVIPLRGNFSPIEYGKAISACEEAKVDAMIIDSASHEWEGEGGVLAQAAENAKTKKGLLVWQKPKIDHTRHFMLRFMQTEIPLVIVCMRAKYPMVEKANPNKGGKKEPARSEILEPKQSEDIISEMFVCGWFDKDHRFHPRKITSRTLEAIFKDGMLFNQETGKQLRAWADGRKVATTARASIPLKAADGASIAGEFATAGEWLDGFLKLVKEAPTADVTGGLWDANSELFMKIRAKADKGADQAMIERCEAVTDLIDRQTAETQEPNGGHDGDD